MGCASHRLHAAQSLHRGPAAGMLRHHCACARLAGCRQNGEPLSDKSLYKVGRGWRCRLALACWTACRLLSRPCRRASAGRPAGRLAWLCCTRSHGPCRCSAAAAVLDHGLPADGQEVQPAPGAPLAPPCLALLAAATACGCGGAALWGPHGCARLRCKACSHALECSLVQRTQGACLLPSALPGAGQRRDVPARQRRERARAGGGRSVAACCMALACRARGKGG